MREFDYCMSSHLPTSHLRAAAATRRLFRGVSFAWRMSTLAKSDLTSSTCSSSSDATVSDEPKQPVSTRTKSDLTPDTTFDHRRVHPPPSSEEPTNDEPVKPARVVVSFDNAPAPVLAYTMAEYSQTDVTAPPSPLNRFNDRGRERRARAANAIRSFYDDICCC